MVFFFFSVQIAWRNLVVGVMLQVKDINSLYIDSYRFDSRNRPLMNGPRPSYMREPLSPIRVERDSARPKGGRPGGKPSSASRGRVGASTPYYAGRRKYDSGDLAQAWATQGRNGWGG